jgi:hypothetical protein
MKACSTTTVRRLTVNLKKAKAFITHDDPKLARTDATNDTSFLIRTQNSMLKIPLLSRKLVYKHVLNQAQQKPAVKGNATGSRTSPYGHPCTNTLPTDRARTSPGESCITM